jgi:hypothetical protein
VILWPQTTSLKSFYKTTQAPQPIQVAASNASSASCLFIGIVFASIGFPEVFRYKSSAC